MEVKERELTVDVPVKATIRPFRKNDWLEKGHDGEYRYSGTAEFLTVQMDPNTKTLNTGLTEKEEKELEKKLLLKEGSLSRYNLDWWSAFSIKVPAKGLELDTNNPMDYIRYKVATVHQEIANGEADKTNNGFARYVLTSEEEIARASIKDIELKSDAFSKFKEMSIADMRDFLKVHMPSNKISDSTKEDFIKGTVANIVEKEPKVFLSVVNDPVYKTKVFIQDCIKASVLHKNSSRYSLPSGDIIGYNIDDAINYILDPVNQSVKIALKAKLDAYNK